MAVALAKTGGKVDYDYDAKIKLFSSDVNPDGSYTYSFDTSNGIISQETGVGGIVAQGATTWISKEGIPLSIEYIADSTNGFKPSGYHLPTPPPIPAHIQRALEYVRTHGPSKSYEPYQHL